MRFPSSQQVRMGDFGQNITADHQGQVAAKLNVVNPLVGILVAGAGQRENGKIISGVGFAMHGEHLSHCRQCALRWLLFR